MPALLEHLDIEPLVVGPVTIANRLIVGTGKYASYEVMQEALDRSGTEVHLELTIDELLPPL